MKYSLYIIARKTGKVVQQVDGNLKSMLNFYCLNNLTKSRDGLVFDNESGICVSWWVGKGKNEMPDKKDPSNFDFTFTNIAKE